MNIDTDQRAVTLLVADADGANREMVAALLSSHGYGVVQAADGLEAWRLVSENQIDLAVVDLHLPRLNGCDFVARCRVTAETAHLPIIAMSGSENQDICEEAFSVGATLYLAKPLKWAILSHHVWYVLRNQARDAELKTLKARMADAPRPALAMTG